jgi:DivIVA domain-containing protein
MNFSTVEGNKRGYSPEQVDGLIARARRQYEQPSLELMTSGVLQAARFSLVDGGYEISEVDAAIARIADQFEEQEIARQIRVGAHRQLRRELDELTDRIGKVVEGGFGRAFSKASGGYDPKLVRAAFSKVKLSAGQIELLDTIELRSQPLGYRRSGLSRLEVDEFFGLVIAAVQRQRALT